MTSYSVTEAANHGACCHIWSKLTAKVGLLVFFDIQESVTLPHVCILKLSRNRLQDSRINYPTWHYLFMRPLKLSARLSFIHRCEGKYLFFCGVYTYRLCLYGDLICLKCHMVEVTTACPIWSLLPRSRDPTKMFLPQNMSTKVTYSWKYSLF